MQHSQRLDQRLHVLREEVRTMTQEKERGECVWRERLQRCQRQLKAKEEEMSRQSQYFESFKSQYQHKLGLARDREQSLQNRIYALEKRLLDVIVSAATSAATVGAVRITAGTVTLQEEQERLTSMRGEGEGEEERKEERMRKCQPGVSPGREGDEGQEGEGHDTKQSSDESRLQGFILSLQEDLRVLLERGEDGLTERRQLMERLSEAQENSHLLGNRVEELKVEVQRLRLTERSLTEEVEELREENDRLQLILREAANQTASQSSSGVEDACTARSSAEVQPSSAAVPPDHLQAAAEVTQRAPDCGSKPNLGLQSLSLSSETTDGSDLEMWSRRGMLDLEQVPSEESDALRDAYRSLGLGEDLDNLREQRDRLDAALWRVQEELELVAQENTQLKLQLREQAEERAADQGSSRETDNNSVPAPDPDDLAQALNQENRALAERIEELMAHIELREAEATTEQSQLRERAARMEQENQDQGCLITELTRKTEDDLNTIMELQQRLDEKPSNAEERGTPTSTCSTQTDESSSVSATGSEHNNQHEGSLLTKTVQSLRTEEEELIGAVTSLREQQEEVAQSVQTKTEEKQQLTRTVWGLKEEKDRIAQCLAGLRQEREQLSRTVCGLKDHRDHIVRSMSGLQEEKEQLTEAVSRLHREKEDQLSSDQIKRSDQSLRTEREQLRREVLNLKQEKAELTTALQCLREQTDAQQRLSGSLSSLRDEEERAEQSITRLRREEEQMALANQSQDRRSDPHGQTQTLERSQRSDPALRTAGQPAQRCLTDNRGKSLQEQRDLLREAEALESKLTRSQEELEKSRTQTKRLQSELCQSEARREETERRAAETGLRLTEAANQVEETRRDNRSLSSQVKELQSKVSDLHRERTDALLLKTQTEQQHNILTAQLKAKTVALDELNSEYIALKRGQGKNDLGAALVSVRTRYNDIRAKYDALLKKRSETDLDTAPLRAKLSCLVVKCQERNRFIAAMMETMQGRGCADAALSQQGELLLSDAALRDYAAAFTPGSSVTSYGLIPRFIATFEDRTSGFVHDQNCPAAPSPASQLPKTGLTADAGGKCRDLRSDGEVSSSSTNITNTPQMSLSTTGPIKETSGLDHLDARGKSSPDLTSSPSPTPPPSSGTRRRLSSPEKIIGLHEQLQRTLMSGYQAPASRGRGQDPRRCLSVSAPADLNLSCELSFTALPSHQATPAGTALPPAADRTATLFNAVAARAARVSFGPGVFPHRHFNANTSKTSTSAVSGSSDESETVPHSPSALGTSSCDSNVSVGPDTNLKRTASETAAPGQATAPECDISVGPGARDGPFLTASWTQPGPRSPETRSSPARKSPGPGAQKTPARPRPDAPAEVRSVEVIKTVGQSSLLIGWERPSLDALGCSNGTFVYGYRVFIDGDFHKSVMSSACTKCVAENVDLSVPIDISVHTLGSNGLSSNGVHTVFRADPR